MHATLSKLRRARETEGGERGVSLLLGALQSGRPGQVVHRLVPRAGPSGGSPAAAEARRRRQTVDPGLRAVRRGGAPMRHRKLSLRHTGLRAVGRAMADADAGRVAAYVLMLLAIHLIRTVRWGLLLKPLGEVSFKRLNSASAVGWMLLMLLPLRLGEFARPLLIARPPPGGG